MAGHGPGAQARLAQRQEIPGHLGPIQAGDLPAAGREMGRIAGQVPPVGRQAVLGQAAFDHQVFQKHVDEGVHLAYDIRQASLGRTAVDRTGAVWRARITSR